MSASAVKAGQAYVEIATRQGALNRGLAAAAARIGGFSKTVGSIGVNIAGSMKFGPLFAVIPPLIGGAASAFGVLGSVLTGTISIFAGLVGAVFSLISPIGLVVAAVVGLGAAIFYYTDAGSNALTMFGQAWQWLLDTVLPVIQAIINSLMSGDFTRAGEILWTSLQLLWYTGIQSLYNMWLDFSTAFLNTIDPFIQPLLEIWASVKEAASLAFEGIKWVWDNTVGAMLSSFDGIQISWGETIQSMSDMWNDTVNWIAKKLLYLYSLFDWSVDYEAAAKDMDSQNEAKKKANRQQRQQRTQAREEQAEALKDTYSDEITDLRKKLQDEMAQVSNEGFKLKMPEAISNVLTKAEEIANAAKAAIPLVDMSMGSQAGTFSGFGAVNMQGQTNDVATRQRAQMLKTLEVEQKLTKKVLERLSQLTTLAAIAS